MKMCLCDFILLFKNVVKIYGQALVKQLIVLV